MKKKYTKSTVNSSFLNIQKDKSLQILKLAFEEITEKYGISSNEILNLIEKKPVSKEILIPISIFEAKLSPLEAVCRYLKEELDLGYTKIALLLNRDSRTIWTTYNNAAKKRKEKLSVKESKFSIPVSVLKDRKFSVFEILVAYLKDNFNLHYSEIAVLLARDERNIWTVYARAKKKKK